jgi:hypothetical protein
VKSKKREQINRFRKNSIRILWVAGTALAIVPMFLAYLAVRHTVLKGCSILLLTFVCRVAQREAGLWLSVGMALGSGSSHFYC